MPELPEVETIKNGLTPYIVGQTIRHAHISRFKMRLDAPKNSRKLLEKSKIVAIKRRSKYLYIHLNSGHTLIIHLGMSGSLTMQETKAIHQKHDHLVLDLDNLSLHFNDPRRFGFYDIQKTENIQQLPYIKHLGIEPLSDEFTVEYLTKMLHQSKRPIKTLLMDSKIIVGIGNIYASELLFSAKISPFTKSGFIPISKVFSLHKSIIHTLEEAIKAGGSSLKDHKQADGTLGYFQHCFKVYGRKNQPCSHCKKPILKVIQSARSTFYCSTCQT